MKKIMLLGLVAALASTHAWANDPLTYVGGKPWRLEQSPPGAYPVPEGQGVTRCQVTVSTEGGLLPWAKKTSILVEPSYADIAEPEAEFISQTYHAHLNLSWDQLVAELNEKGSFSRQEGSCVRDRNCQLIEIKKFQTATQAVWEIHVAVYDNFIFVSGTDQTCQILPGDPRNPPRYDRTSGRLPTLI